LAAKQVGEEEEDDEEEEDEEEEDEDGVVGIDRRKIRLARGWRGMRGSIFFRASRVPEGAGGEEEKAALIC
jgi:hypothetical protein